MKEFFSQHSPLVKEVFDAIHEASGSVYVVGGYVRDICLNIPTSHDVDVEVYGLTPIQLENVLNKFGKIELIGKQFGVYKLEVLPQFDFALARVETKSGKRHQSFDVYHDVHLSIDLATKRRDLTINAMLLDPYKNNIIDPFNGLEDIKKKIIQVVDEKSFKEDPLRVLRVARMQAKLPDFDISLETEKICKEMVEDLKHLSKERIYEEYTKILMASLPSSGFKFLLKIEALPQVLLDLKYTHQRSDFHPEGDVFIHTMLVVDLAALCKHKTRNKIGFMYSALLHDIGKPSVTTPEGKAPNHDLAGEKLAYQYMFDLSQNKQLSKYVSIMVRCHMALMNASRKDQSGKVYLKVLRRLDGLIDVDDLILLCKCDKLGRSRLDAHSILVFDQYIHKMKEEYGTKAIVPFVTGNDLIECGYRPSDQFKKILEKAYDLQLSGYDKEALIEYIKKTYKR